MTTSEMKQIKNANGFIDTYWVMAANVIESCDGDLALAITKSDHPEVTKRLKEVAA